MGSYTPVIKATREQNINEDMPNDPSAMIIDDNDQPASARTEHKGPIHGRFVHGEINTILDQREIHFRTAYPYALLPLSKYYLREWSEVEHLFLPVIDLYRNFTATGHPAPARRPLVSASKRTNKL